ncbi:penicillin acylase family protein [Flavilitoribacter nigricans]|nr:penicillin acylase family protein [Flavilitoribacter nigricans]
MIRIFFSIPALFFFFTVSAQVDPERITIARDEWGVPHIFAPTDAEVAYGFAWATAEDDFRTIQEQLLPVRNLAGLVMGKQGAFMDVAVHLMDSKEIVEERFESDLSPEFREVLAGYAAGINAYAAAHPQEVLHKKLFPVHPKEIIEIYILGMSLMSGIDRDLGAILQERLPVITSEEGRGSNAFAISRQKTRDGKTYLAINSHQPMEGMNSWYEAHLCSEEGWNILGATFPGGVSIFLGANPYLGWAHTVNHGDLADVYQLTMHPENEDQYRFDGEWLSLEPYHTKARIKLLGLIPVGAKQKFYKSKYGVTFKTGQGVFALRFPANRDIRAAEQWYRMNKATDWESFRAALNMQAIISTNIVYADRDDHIFYVSNGRFPVRDPKYNWRGVLPGDTSATLWADNYYPLDSLAQVLDPAAGYVYNCNHSPFLSTAPEENPRPDQVPATMGYRPAEVQTNRGVRFAELIEQYDQLDYEDFKKIKYDVSYTSPLEAYPRLEPIFHLAAEKYPDIRAEIDLLHNWDRAATLESHAASLFIVSLKYLQQHPQLRGESSLRTGPELDEAKLVEAIRHSRDYFQEHFGSRTVPLAQLQRHSRGDVSLPMPGAPDVLGAIYSQTQKNGVIRPFVGESYIQLARFSEQGVELETVNAFGASSKAGSTHYTDQMPLFTQQQLKTMTLDKEKILAEAKRIYHPQ